MRGVGPRLGCAGSFQYSRDRLREYFEVQQKRPLVHILEVQLHPLVEMDCTSAVYLPQTSDSRPYAEATPLPVFIKPLVIPKWQWPGSHQAHVTFQDIYELR